MKAWRVDNGDPRDGCLLVYAPTPAQARVLGMEASPAPDWLDEYAAVRATREPRYDDIFLARCVIDSNGALPQDLQDFYQDEQSHIS